jgi:hypothetical protein
MTIERPGNSLIWAMPLVGPTLYVIVKPDFRMEVKRQANRADFRSSNDHRMQQPPLLAVQSLRPYLASPGCLHLGHASSVLVLSHSPLECTAAGRPYRRAAWFIGSVAPSHRSQTSSNRRGIPIRATRSLQAQSVHLGGDPPERPSFGMVVLHDHKQSMGEGHRVSGCPGTFD